jgi:hypothetical protein
VLCEREEARTLNQRLKRTIAKNFSWRLKDMCLIPVHWTEIKKVLWMPLLVIKVQSTLLGQRICFRLTYYLSVINLPLLSCDYFSTLKRLICSNWKMGISTQEERNSFQRRFCDDPLTSGIGLVCPCISPPYAVREINSAIDHIGFQDWSD